MMLRTRIVNVTAALFLGSASLYAEPPGPKPPTPDSRELAGGSGTRPNDDTRKLVDLSLEELMSIDVEVHSASRKTETLKQAAAAIFVLNSEDIRRSGAGTIPDALRMVPGIYVGTSNQHNEIVSARGFSDYMNNKMLVLVDGRNLYSPEFGGTYWALHNLPLEDIERIEVIRGPGGTLWGANAINGVINIITKDSQETQGEYLATSIGSRKMGSARYGASALKGRLTYRIFARGDTWQRGLTPSGAEAFDGGNQTRAGLRADWRISEKDVVMLEAEQYRGNHENLAEALNDPAGGQSTIRQIGGYTGGDFVLRWRRQLSTSSNLELLGSCGWKNFSGISEESRRTCEAEFQHSWQIRPRHSLIWGAMVEPTQGAMNQSFAIHGVPREDTTVTASAYGQYEFALIPDLLRVIGGSKVERNSYTGFEIQPQIRMVWSPVPSHTIWGAVSRAVRTPTRVQENVDVVFTQLPGPVPTFLTVVGNPNLKSEVLRAYEIGYRFEPSHKFTLDTAVFYNHYERLINGNLFDPLGAAGNPVLNWDPTYLEFRLPWQNLDTGQTHGVEISANWRALDRWNLAVGVTELRGIATGYNSPLNLPMNNTPRHQFNVQSRLNLTSRWEFDSSLYHYNGIPEYSFAGATYQNVPTHNRLDLGLSWRNAKGFSFGVWGHDITSGHRWENRSSMFMTNGAEVRGRSVAFKLAWNVGPPPESPTSGSPKQ